MKRDSSLKFNRPYDFRTPDVLLELDWPVKTKLNTFLEVELQFCNKSNKEIERKHISRAPWEKEIGLYKYSMTQKDLAKQGGLLGADPDDLDAIKK